MKNTVKALQNWVLLVQHCWEQLRLLSATWSHFVYITVNKENLLHVSGGSLIALGASLAQKKQNKTVFESYFCERYLKPITPNFPSHPSKWLLSS